MSRITIAYIFWALGGLFGLHHIYLGRLTHAIFFNLTIGFFGLGFVYDFFHIPNYVKQANSDPIYLGLLRKKMKERPPASIPRAFALYVSAYCFSHLSLTLLGPIEPIEARIGDIMVDLPVWWTILTSFIQTIGILIGCLLINSIGGQRTVSRSYLYLPILIGTICDVIFAVVLKSRMFIMCRALFPMLFYFRSCEWLPMCANPKPPHFSSPARFTKLFLQYLLCTTVCISLIFGSMYFYCDVFVGNDGSIEYSDTNYGIGLDHTFTFPGMIPLDIPVFKPNDIDIQTEKHFSVEKTSGKQPQYSYSQFQDELFNFYHNFKRYQQLGHKNTPNNTTIELPEQLITGLNSLSLPYSYRVRDVFRNLYFSSILKPVHTHINYYNINYKPGFDPLFPSFHVTDPLSVSNTICAIFTDIYHKITFGLNCIYYFVQNSSTFLRQNSLSDYIIELDPQGLSWADAYITYLNNGGCITHQRGKFDENNLKQVQNIIINFIATRLDTVDGHVRLLGYWPQRALYDAIVAYGRLTHQYH
jgi:hypothetical protein